MKTDVPQKTPALVGEEQPVLVVKSVMALSAVGVHMN